MSEDKTTEDSFEDTNSPEVEAPQWHAKPEKILSGDIDKNPLIEEFDNLKSNGIDINFLRKIFPNGLRSSELQSLLNVSSNELSTLRKQARLLPYKTHGGHIQVYSPTDIEKAIFCQGYRFIDGKSVDAENHRAESNDKNNTKLKMRVYEAAFEEYREILRNNISAKPLATYSDIEDFAITRLKEFIFQLINS